MSVLLLLACGEGPLYFDPEPGEEPGDSLAVVGCADPVEAGWDEVGEAWGLVGGAERLVDHLDGGGLALGDVDGAEDLVVAWESGVVLHRRGEDLREREQLASELGGAPVLQDLDGDGHPELVVADAGLALRGQDGNWDLMFEREGPHKLRGPAVADLDGDGRVDLYLARTSPEHGSSMAEDSVAWGEAGGLTEDTEAVPEARRGGQAFQAILVDADSRRGPDVYLDNDMGETVRPNALLLSDPQGLVDGTEACACGLAHSGMGGVAADIDGDGVEDLYLAGTSSNVLLVGDGLGGYIDATAARNANPLASAEMSWGVAAGDLDNDGRMDLVASRGDLWSTSHPGQEFQSSIAVLHQAGDGQFSDIAPALGLDGQGSWRAVILEDLNDDGVLDMIIGEVTGRPALYLSRGCTDQSWIEVDAPPDSRVVVTAGGQQWVAWARTQSGFATSRPARVHIGLGDHERVESVRVIPPWGVPEIEVEGPISARQRLDLRG